MPRSRMRVVVIIEDRNEYGELNHGEKWDIISAAAIATRAAIEHYIEPKLRSKAIDAAAMAVRAPFPDKMVRKVEKMVEISVDTPKTEAHNDDER